MKRILLFSITTLLAVVLSAQAAISEKQAVVTETKKDGYVKETVGRNTYAGYYMNGQKTGAWVTYNEKDLLREVVEYKGDIKNGVAITFDAQGELVKEEHFVNGEYDGEVREYLRGNYIVSKSIYTKGILNGPYVRYYTDKPGVIMEESNYKNGEKDGLSKWYTGEGLLLATYSYQKGIFEGTNYEYYPNGNLMNETPYHNDIPTGIYNEYHEDGKTLKLTGKYVNGVKHGDWIETNTNGNVVKKMKYVNGELK
ncbi:MAG: hypothetical protein PHU62_04750 [Bacteroidales bacterium]|jgi:antitoxin component YwqK of YwqJK toxin-antitoxin module|nr:hypothetical protein [Bacteroidales bacterium]MDD2204797.1 hypothetical protein [Bacteroidales bacterium]MDD3151645.1 hypothetical protein [Bacteroidales bacterium]MDD3914020.1 hypothetical protein [Bacteroidales bacterium]MDD4633870.1 hypothetical protein [Bacteroidales bacterium]